MKLFGMTDWQMKVVEAVIKHGSYQEAAKFLQVRPTAIRAVFYKLRINYQQAKSFTNKMEEYRRKLGAKRRYLTA